MAAGFPTLPPIADLFGCGLLADTFLNDVTCCCFCYVLLPFVLPEPVPLVPLRLPPPGLAFETLFLFADCFVLEFEIPMETLPPLDVAGLEP